MARSSRIVGALLLVRARASAPRRRTPRSPARSKAPSPIRRPASGSPASRSRSPRRRLQGEQTEFTDADGHYIITELPPGEYLVRFYFANINVERPGVFLQTDKTLSVNVAIPTQKAEVKTYRITEKAPTVDVGNTQQQTAVTNELVRNTPVQRPHLRRRPHARARRRRPKRATGGVLVLRRHRPREQLPHRRRQHHRSRVRPARHAADARVHRRDRDHHRRLQRRVRARHRRRGQRHHQVGLEQVPRRRLGLRHAVPARSAAGRPLGRIDRDPDQDQVRLRLRLRPRRADRQGQGLVLRRLPADVHSDENDRFMRSAPPTNAPGTMSMAHLQGDLDPNVESAREGLDKAFCNTPGLLRPAT